jgi:hypothetical protein
MASPARHKFWQHVLDLLPLTRFASEVLDATGPSLLTGAYLTYPSPQEVRVESCHLFCAQDTAGRTSVAYAQTNAEPLARHYWAGTWINVRNRTNLGTAARTAFYQGRHLLTRGKTLRRDDPALQVDPQVLAQPVPSGNHVAILVPVRDAAAHILPFIEEVRSLDYPKGAIKLVFCEGDSLDGTWERLNEIAVKYQFEFRDIVLSRRQLGTKLDRAKRWKPSLQRQRRGGLAVVRNHLIDVGLDKNDDWALWIDVDVWRFPKDIIQQLISARSRIVAPHCVRFPGGPTFDQNSFISRPVRPAYRYHQYLSRWTVSGTCPPPFRAGFSWTA